MVEMRKIGILGIPLLLLILISVGCSSKAKDMEIANLKDQLYVAEARIDSLEQRSQMYEVEARDLRRELSTLATREELEMEIEEKYTLLRVSEELLFSSGSDKISSNGKRILDDVAEIFKRFEHNDIRVEGHTDDKKIKPEFQVRFKSNWELSTARATAVVHYMIEKHGIDPSRLIAVGYGSNRPVTSNDTTAGRAQNRRVEFYITPAKLPVKPLGVQT